MRTFVKDAGKMGWALRAFQVFQQLPKHVAETCNRIDRHTITGAVQHGQGMVGAEDISARVYQVEVAVIVERRAGHR